MTDAESKKPTVVLSDGTEVTIDPERVRAMIRTRKQLKATARLDPKSDDYDTFLANLTGLEFETVENLDIKDYAAIDAAVGEVVQEVLRPNAG